MLVVVKFRWFTARKSLKLSKNNLVFEFSYLILNALQKFDKSKLWRVNKDLPALSQVQ